MGISGNGTNRRSSTAGPRRLRTSMATPPTAGRSPSRNGAGDGSALAAIGRISQNQVAVLCAAKFKRRNDSARMLFCHNTTPPHDPFFSTISVDQSASPVEAAVIHSRRLVSIPQERNAMACGMYGGWMSTIRCSFAKCARIGLRSCSSPKPGFWIRSSTSWDCGHPPLGNSASRTAWPVVRVLARETASSLARHTSGNVAGSIASAGEVDWRAAQSIGVSNTV